jgi:hypothetical protein
MEESTRTMSGKETLPFILLAAVTQGWSLYGLHHANQWNHWPATDPAWLLALYAVTVFIPVTVQLLADYARAAALWWLVAVLAVAYFYVGWYYGSDVILQSAIPFFGVERHFPVALELTILWLMALPFAQIRLATGHWSIQYPALFANAWRNVLMLAEATLFTGLFWLMLFLWQMLFHMLGIDYFKDLFQEPIFVYPVTSLSFGCALHLIGSIDRMTSVVLEQLLNVLKWLALLAGAILALFSIALVFKLPGLVFTGKRAIDAAWLLWLMAVVVLLLNAAFRDGTVPQPYPKWVARFLRLVVPLTVIIAATALYALMMRSRLFGLTVERVWGFVVVGAALLYAVGYSRSAFAKGAWFAGIARVNVVAALALMTMIAAALTPLLSPYRLAANSQFRIIREKGISAVDNEHPGRLGVTFDSPLQYLRFESGRYGRVKLQELAELQTGKDAEEISRQAKRLLAQTNRWEMPPTLKPEAIAASVAKLRIFPAGRTLDQDLSSVLTADLVSPSKGFVFRNALDKAAGIYVNLSGDNAEQFVYMTDNSGVVYEKRGGHWVGVASLYADRPASASRYGWDLFRELANGDVAATPPRWNDLSIGDQKFKVNGH